MGNRRTTSVKQVISKSISILILLLSAISAFSTEISLTDAINRKLVTVSIAGNDYSTTGDAGSSYYGGCLLMTIENRSKTLLKIHIEAGLLFSSSDTLEQRMMLTREEMLALAPAKKHEQQLFAMCTQMHHQSPGSDSHFSPGKLAEGNLLAVARFLSENNYQSQAAQQAVWVVSDNNDPGSIYSENQQETARLQEFVCKLTGKKIPPAPHRIHYTSGMVEGEIVFENKNRETYSFVMQNENGETIGIFFENKTIPITVLTTLTWRFRFNGFEGGVYYVKLLNSKKEAVVTRPVVIN